MRFTIVLTALTAGFVAAAPNWGTTTKAASSSKAVSTSKVVSSSKAATSSAAPVPKPGSFKPCGPLGTPQCCATDVLGVADLNCQNPSRTPKSNDDFIALCAAVGQQAECCAIPLLGQGIICNKPTPDE